MGDGKRPAVTSKDEPEDHDFPAAGACLSLLAPTDGCHRVCASYHLAENTDIHGTIAAIE